MKQPIKAKDLIDGNNQVLQSLYEENIALILPFVTGNGCSLDEARDIYHQSLYLLINGLEEGWIEPSTGNIKLNHYSIARVLLQQVLADKKVDVTGMKHIHEFIELDQSIIKLRLAAVHSIDQLMKTLAEPGRTVLKETVANQVSLSDIAVRLNFSNVESAVNNKHKAIQTLIESI
jgi:DNA-directed RNA polymerase specialized sigma24 family protein